MSFLCSEDGHDQVRGDSGQNQNSLERLFTSSGLGMPRVPQEERLKLLLRPTSFMCFQETSNWFVLNCCRSENSNLFSFL